MDRTKKKGGARPKRQALTATVMILRSSFRLVLWQETLKSSCIDSGKRRALMSGKMYSCVRTCMRVCIYVWVTGWSCSASTSTCAHETLHKDSPADSGKHKNTNTLNTRRKDIHTYIYLCVYIYMGQCTTKCPPHRAQRELALSHT